MIDGVDQMAFLQGKTGKSAREGVPANNGTEMWSASGAVSKGTSLDMSPRLRGNHAA